MKGCGKPYMWNGVPYAPCGEHGVFCYDCRQLEAANAKIAAMPVPTGVDMSDLLDDDIHEPWTNEELIAAARGMRQPDPIPGREAIVPLVMADLTERMKAGIKTYGRPLESHNGRDALRDAYDEILDCAMYLKQAMIERDNPLSPNNDNG
jgi:hypothetical protein